MVGIQVDIMLQQGLQTTLLHAPNLGRLITPKIAMVYQHSIRLQPHSLIQQCLTGRYPGHDMLNIRSPFNLQAIRAVILELPTLQQFVQTCFQLQVIHRIPLVVIDVQRKN